MRFRYPGALDGDDLRDLPLSMRKTNLERLLRGRPDGIFVNPFEIGAIGPDLFRAACDTGLEGLVSKRSGRPYRGGRSSDWIKVKNRKHNAFDRVADGLRVDQNALGDACLPRRARVERPSPTSGIHHRCIGTRG